MKVTTLSRPGLGEPWCQIKNCFPSLISCPAGRDTTEIPLQDVSYHFLCLHCDSIHWRNFTGSIVYYPTDSIETALRRLTSEPGPLTKPVLAGSSRGASCRQIWRFIPGILYLRYLARTLWVCLPLPPNWKWLTIKRCPICTDLIQSGYIS